MLYYTSIILLFRFIELSILVNLFEPILNLKIIINEFLKTFSNISLSYNRCTMVSIIYVLSSQSYGDLRFFLKLILNMN